ncbi:hypothetical protein [Paenibacillus macquariensis]|uniref:Uncharacterized protein n=1 Tax=Paenibacillus macquariensis TaxID=948756 RepID=A0ABY1KAU9_9BACL|nr:hypothetical protein [Paenibacillus macquariensis]MEC0089482.1 hypothetical protein [Paenibacillus macquariensis]SIR52632.1 hypothetical protein SAMN05421578_11734 [Paenibacillus macquariensis]
MSLFIIIVMIIGVAGIIGNQNSGLRRMEQLQRSLDEINRSLQAMSNKKD